MTENRDQTGLIARLWRAFLATSEAAVAANFRAPWAQPDERDRSSCRG